MREIWVASGSFLRQATLEVAREKGGQPLVNTVANMLGPGGFPEGEVFELLEETEPGATEEVFKRAEELQAMNHEFMEDSLQQGEVLAMIIILSATATVVLFILFLLFM
jgi:hypothetical protein